MGLIDSIKGLIGGSGVADLAEQVGLGEHLTGITEAIQQPAEELTGLQEDLGEVAAPIEGVTDLLP